MFDTTGKRQKSRKDGTTKEEVFSHGLNTDETRIRKKIERGEAPSVFVVKVLGEIGTLVVLPDLDEGHCKLRIANFQLEDKKKFHADA